MNTAIDDEPDRPVETDGGVIGRRTLAFLVDGIVVAAVVTALGRLRSARSDGRSVPRTLLATAVGTGLAGIPYHVVLEGAFGQTVGKRLLGIAVRREGGGPCTLTAAAVRTVLRLVDWLPAGYLLGFVSIATSDRNQRVGDHCAGTVVTRTGGAHADDDRTDDTRMDAAMSGATTTEFASTDGASTDRVSTDGDSSDGARTDGPESGRTGGRRGW